jgi:hypothetical protein
VLAVHFQPHGTDIEMLLGALEGALGKALCLGQGPEFAHGSRAFLQSVGEEFASPVAGKGRGGAGSFFAKSWLAVQATGPSQHGIAWASPWATVVKARLGCGGPWLFLS